MRQPLRPLVGLLAAGALLLSGCGAATTPEASTTAGQTEATSADAGSAGDRAPGDLLPSGEGGEPTDPQTGHESTDPPAEADPTGPQTEPEPTDDNGDGPELGGPGIPACDLLDLPATTLDTIEDIQAGGPYQFPRNDGVTFQNREGILPDESRDYYREFTVVTPNLDHRGARRIVTGGGVEIDPDHWYFTGDHYESFCEFDPDRS